MATRRSFLSSLAVTAALWSFRPPSFARSVAAAPPLNRLVVKDRIFTNVEQLSKYLHYDRLRFQGCQFFDLDIAKDGWEFEHCYFRGGSITINARGKGVYFLGNCVIGADAAIILDGGATFGCRKAV